MKRDILVIGASAGGIEAVSKLLSPLPADLPAAVFLVVHMSPYNPSVLPAILANRTHLTIEHALDGKSFQPGVVYVAPPDRHLLITNGSIAVARGPKENRHRPSVDVLFRSAAYTHGPRVIAIVLSGNLDDGAAGLWAVKSCGGISIVQHPDEALFPGMPRSAIRFSDVDYVESIDAMPPIITDLIGEEVMDGEEVRDAPPPQEVTTGESAMRSKPDADQFGTPSYFTCPACSGTLWEYREGDMLRYRCRVGHAFSMESMEAEQADVLERAMWTAIRTLDEKADLMRRLKEKTRDQNTPHALRRFEERQKEAEDNADALREMMRVMKEIGPANE